MSDSVPEEKGPEKKRVSLKIIGEGASKKTLLEEAQIGDEQGTERAPLAWIGLGAMAIFVVLVPLAMLSMAVLKWAGGGASNGAALVVVSLGSVSLSSLAGGFLIGRFGPLIDARRGAFAGGLAGLVMWALSFTLAGVVIVVVTSGAAALGALIGRRRKP